MYYSEILLCFTGTGLRKGFGELRLNPVAADSWRLRCEVLNGKQVNAERYKHQQGVCVWVSRSVLAANLAKSHMHPSVKAV